VDWVWEKIKKLPTRKACGKDGITAVVLKALVDVLAGPLATIINRSIKEGIFPEEWKSAVVVPIPKTKEPPATTDDFRPISLLSLASKIAEAYYFEQLYSKIEEGLNEAQFGFRRNRSTTDALLYFEHLTMTGFERCKRKNKAGRVAAVFFDVKKAFDSVPHGDLLERLAGLGLPEHWNKLLASYLKGRTLAVRVGEATSEKFEVSSGVPQGSVLGPLLFVAYVDRIFDTKISPDARLVMYADDLAYIKPLVNAKDEEELQEDVEKLARSYEGLKLSLNAKKSVCMIMTPKPSGEELDLKMGGDTIKQVETFKYLGVDLDPKLTYKNHVARIAVKGKQVLGALCRTIRKWADPAVFERLYKTTVEPIIGYAIESWYPSQVVLQNKIERVKKYAAKLVANNFTKPYADLLEKLNWKSLSQTVMEKRAILTHAYVNERKRMPDAAFKLSDARRSARLGHEKGIAIPHAGLTTTAGSSINTMRRLWKALPEEVACKINPTGFRRAVRSPGIYKELQRKKELRRIEYEID